MRHSLDLTTPHLNDMHFLIMAVIHHENLVIKRLLWETWQCDHIRTTNGTTNKNYHKKLGNAIM